MQPRQRGKRRRKVSEFIEVSDARAIQLGKMISSFKDSFSRPISFNQTVYVAKCFGYECSLLIHDTKGYFYKEEKETQGE